MLKAPTELAYEAGRQAAEAAATWTCDGNTDARDARALLRLIDDGDPRAWEYLPARPTLSGEWAGDATPLSLARDITGDENPAADTVERLADAWEDGVGDRFEAACAEELAAAAR